MLKIFILSISLLFVSAVSAQSIRVNSASQPAESSLSILDNISIYPNPVVDILKISVKSTDNTNITINFFNNIGKLRLTQVSEIEPGVNLISIDLKNRSINSGVYFVEIISDKDRITRKLIVK